MRLVIRLLLVFMLVTLPLTGWVEAAHAMPAAEVAVSIDHTHCAEHPADDSTPHSGHCAGQCDCCIGSAMPAGAASDLPAQFSGCVAPMRSVAAPVFITSAPDRPPRLRLA